MKKQHPRFARIPSLSEQLYLDAAAMGYNLAQRAYIKIDCAPDIFCLEEAYRQALSQIPGTDLCYNGTVWLKAEAPSPCRVIESDALHPCQVTLPPLDWRTNTIDLQVIHLQKEDIWYLCFSLFHGAGDGTSLMNFLYAFFAALRQESPGSFDDSVQEHDFTKRLKRKMTRIPLIPACHPSDPGEPGDPYRLIRTEDAPYLPTALLCYLTAACFSPGKAVMLVPINLRRFWDAGSTQLMGNLALPLFVDASQKSVSQIWADIHAYAAEGRIPVFGKLPGKLYRCIPGRLRRWVLGQYIHCIHRWKRVPAAALISNIGKVRTAALENPYFRVVDCWVGFENLPVFSATLISLSWERHTNTCISTHGSSLSAQACQSLADNITHALQNSAID